MDRRELLQSAAAFTLAAAATSAFAADEHSHHHEHGSESKYSALIAAASDCVVKGETCLAHCLTLLGDGDRAMAGCSKAVNQMLALCGALQNLAAQGSKLTPSLAKVALDACSECAKECEQHAEHHAECKACRESCLECIKQCKAIAA